MRLETKFQHKASVDFRGVYMQGISYAVHYKWGDNDWCIDDRSYKPLSISIIEPCCKSQGTGTLIIATTLTFDRESQTPSEEAKYHVNYVKWDVVAMVIVQIKP